MLTDQLTLFQWLSPAYPISGYAYSHGLETAVDAGWVCDAVSLSDWLADVVQHGSGRSDAIWLRLAWDCETADQVQGLAAEARAFAPTSERLREGERQGAAFAEVTRDVWGLDVPHVILPLAVGYAAAQRQIAVDQVIPLYAQSFVSNLVAAAQRLLPIGQTGGQQVIAALAPISASLVEDTKDAALDDIASSAFLSDIASMRHETQDVRLFQS